MKNFLVFILCLLLSTLVAHGACVHNTRSIWVPAVVSGQEGGILELIVSVVDGNGSVYTKISPVVGTSTQYSQSKAVEQAFLSANMDASKCDVYFSFSDTQQQSPAVDGPSAGLAMTIIVKSAIENTSLRDDVVITGAILDDFQVGAVGGIIDKAQASSRFGKKILISPTHAMYEKILLAKLSQEYDFVALEVTTLDQAYKIATSDKSKKYSSNKSDFKLNTIPANLPTLNLTQDEKRFINVAQGINSQLIQISNSFSDSSLSQYADYFESQAIINEKITQMGYGYTAANNAFLSQIDAKFLDTASHKINLSYEIDIALNCVYSIPNISVNSNNYEWVAGVNARRNWANTKIDDINKTMDDYDSEEQKYLALREIYYANSWCLASKEMANVALEIQGDALNVSSFEKLANDHIDTTSELIEKSVVKNSDSLWHIEIAKNASSTKDYLGAIFDSSYARASQYYLTGQNEYSKEDIESDVSNLILTNYSSFWARIYQSQGIYTYYEALGNNVSKQSSHSVLLLATTMEESFLDVKAQIKNPTISNQVQTTNVFDATEYGYSFVIEALCWILLCILFSKLILVAYKK